MFGTLISVKPEPELFDSTEALELRRVDQPNDQSTLGVIAQRNYVVNGIAINPLRQFLVLLIEENGGSLTQRLRPAGWMALRGIPDK